MAKPERNIIVAPVITLTRWSRWWLFLGCGLAFAGAALSALGAEIEVTGPTIELPKFVVTEGRELPPPESWRYAEIPGYEILSNASAGNTQRFVRDFQRLQQVIEVISPFLQRLGSPLPTSLLLYGRGQEFDLYLTRDQQEVGYDSLVVDPGTDAFATGTGRERALACRFLQNDELAAVVVDLQGTGEGLYDPYRQFYRQYVRFLLSRLKPRSPPWLEEGLARIFSAVEFTDKWISFAQVGDGFGGTRDGDFNVAMHRRALVPLGELFTGNENIIQNDPILPYQAHAFVHLCLYGEGKRYQQPFLTFLSRAGTEPVTEKLFQECFKMNYAKMGIVLRGYIDFTVHQSIEFKAKKGQKLPEPPPVALREATQAEIGRIKGQALLLAGRGAAARVALIAPYIRGERDPQLLAALGLYEHDHGQDERARKFLDAAVAAKTTRARAYVELARLRFAEVQAQPAGTGGNLSVEQTARVLQPLFTARTLRPVLPDVYLLIAETWARSAFKPNRDNLGVLAEGVRRFPRHAELILRAAELNAANGYPGDAAAILDFGLKARPDPAAKAQFEEMKASLPAPKS